MKQSLGMVETEGLVVLLEAVDAMLKAAHVTFVGWQSIGSGLVTAFVEGDLAAVKISTDAGAEAAARIGRVVAVNVIAQPHERLYSLIQKAGTGTAADLVEWGSSNSRVRPVHFEGSLNERREHGIVDRLATGDALRTAAHPEAAARS